MKEISINQNSSTERVKFGPVGRDIILNEKIEDETARAIAKETQLEQAIAQAGAVKDVKCDGTSIVVSKVADIGPSIDTKVLVETTRATAAETTLTNNLAAEVTNRTTADTTLQTNINNEATARQSADTAEAAARTAADANLQEQVNNLKARGRYLSLWNSTTGKPADDPTQLPYVYKAGDYYIIGTVGTGLTLYKPEGTEYTGDASTSVETREVSINDVYYFDGTNWAFQSNAQKEVSFSGLAGQPTDNTALATALNSKVDLSSAQTITGVKTFSNGIKILNDNLVIDSLYNADLRIKASTCWFDGDYFAPLRPNQVDFGTKYNSFKNLYLSGSANLGDWKIGQVTDYPNKVRFTYQDTDRFEFTTNTLAPVTDGQFHLGFADKKLGDIYLGGAVKFPTSSTTDYLELKGESNGNVSINRKFNNVDYQVVVFSGNNATFVYGLMVVDVPLQRSDTFNSLHIGGDKNLSLNGNIYPQYNNGKSIGTSSYKWGDLYLSGTAHIGGASLSESGGVSTLTSWLQVNGNLLPDGTASNRTLGSSSKAWKDLYLSEKAYFNNSYITTDSWGALLLASDTGEVLSNSHIIPNDTGKTLGKAGYIWEKAFVKDIEPTSASDLYLGNSSSMVYSRGYTLAGSGSLGDNSHEWSSLQVKNINMSGSLSAEGTQGTAGQVLTSNGPDAPATWTNSVLPSTEAAQTVSGNIKICVVTALPENPDANTIYFIV